MMVEETPFGYGYQGKSFAKQVFREKPRIVDAKIRKRTRRTNGTGTAAISPARR